ncbi:phosphodiester glycosidase family protein [Anoxynatronum sibiricum]|uniref:Phosphodiester glycosidase family protein n=1 Tax=Anoxynatronum sibiricum TaxID=210623 RepID=A0ABU9VPM6_9CLOT
MINNYSFKKKWIGVALATLVSIGALVEPVAAQTWIFEEKTTENIAGGASYQRILRFGEQGWQHVNVIRVNLNDQYTKLDLLQSAGGVSQRETLTNMLQRADNPVAGINADFFYLTNPDSPMGIMVRDGSIVSSPVLEKPYSTLAVTNEGQAFLTDWHNHLYVSTEAGGIFSISAYNKITWNYHMITMMDRNWGEKSPGAGDEYRDLVEVVVADGVVTEIRRGLPSVTIPENGYVLLASGQNGQQLLQGIRQGERITFYDQTTPNLQNIQLAVGGGTVLVRNGQTVAFSEPVAGNHPRTAVGINRAGNELIMVTIDGRHRSYTGVDGQKLAALMIELGSDQAILMDGGGSTTMAVRQLGESAVKVVNAPSDGNQRRIINGLAVNTTAPQGELAGLMFTAGQESVFVNQPMNLQVSGYDTYYQAYPLESGAVTYRVVEGKGRVENQQLIAEAAGTLILEASFQGKSVSQTIQALSEVAGLQIHVPRYTLNPGASMLVTVEGIDPNGFRAPLSMSRVQITDQQGLGTLSNGVYQAGQREGTTVLRASYNGYQAAVPLSIGMQRQAAASLETYQPAFLGYPAAVKGSVSTVSGGAVNPNALRLDFDLTGAIETTAAYVVFGQSISIPAQTSRISLRVNATETAPHWIRGQVRDAAGQTHTVDFKQGIDWMGWNTLEGNLPQGVTFPAVLERIYVVETDPFFKTRGTLLFDGIEFLAPLTLPVLTPEEAGGQVADPVRKVPAQAEGQWLVHGGGDDNTVSQQLLRQLQNGYQSVYVTGNVTSELRSQAGNRIIGGNGGHTANQTGQQMVIYLDNSQDGLRKTNYQQWPWLMNTLKGNLPEQILVFLPKPIWGPQGFGDELEADLLGEQFKKLADQGKQVFVFHGNSSAEVELRDGVRYIGVARNGQQGVALYQSGGRLSYQLINLADNTAIPGVAVQEKVQETVNTPAPIPVNDQQVSFRVGQRYYMAGSEQISLDTAPYIKNGRLMVPVAHISRALGIPRENVEWDGLSETVMIRGTEGQALLMTIGSRQLWVEDEAVDMGVAAEITNDRSFVPISRFAAALGIEYQWYPENETVIF